jgi:hypothetical protein
MRAVAVHIHMIVKCATLLTSAGAGLHAISNHMIDIYANADVDGVD